ncbi:MAG: hemolysin III family protein [Gemmatimonas sp.]|nr:hemolysin III family protein [Gemmatimonas sp.]
MIATSSAREEFANAITHGAGLVASLVAGTVLITLASLTRDPWQIVAASIYVASLVVLYAASTAYHAARRPRVKANLKVFDHCAIFGLIAGTYTPFTLTAMRGGWGWTLFGVVWALAGVGMLMKLISVDRFPLLSTLFYLAMGWLIVVAIRPLQLALPGDVLLWIIAGGLMYSIGTLFYHSRRLPYGHAVWHLFVLGGSACHFVAVLSQMLPHLPA